MAPILKQSEIYNKCDFGNAASKSTFLQMRKWALRDLLTSYLRHSVITNAVICYTSFACHFFSHKSPSSNFVQIQWRR